MAFHPVELFHSLCIFASQAVVGDNLFCLTKLFCDAAVVVVRRMLLICFSQRLAGFVQFSSGGIVPAVSSHHALRSFCTINGLLQFGPEDFHLRRWLATFAIPDCNLKASARQYRPTTDPLNNCS